LSGLFWYVMAHVFLLWHTHELEGNADEKLIGVCASEDDAKAAIARVSDKPGFAEHPSGFEICEYELGKDHWTEGFAAISPEDL
jgi:hypothetical protein